MVSAEEIFMSVFGPLFRRHGFGEFSSPLPFLPSFVGLLAASYVVSLLGNFYRL